MISLLCPNCLEEIEFPEEAGDPDRSPDVAAEMCPGCGDLVAPDDAIVPLPEEDDEA